MRKNVDVESDSKMSRKGVLELGPWSDESELGSSGQYWPITHSWGQRSNETNFRHLSISPMAF